MKSLTGERFFTTFKINFDFNNFIFRWRKSKTRRIRSRRTGLAKQIPFNTCNKWSIKLAIRLMDTVDFVVALSTSNNIPNNRMEANHILNLTIQRDTFTSMTNLQRTVAVAVEPFIQSLAPTRTIHFASRVSSSVDPVYKIPPPNLATNRMIHFWSVQNILLLFLFFIIIPLFPNFV